MTERLYITTCHFVSLVSFAQHMHIDSRKFNDVTTCDYICDLFCGTFFPFFSLSLLGLRGIVIFGFESILTSVGYTSAP